MSEVNRDIAFNRAVDLVVNQDNVAQKWTGRYIAIQTSLAIAAAALLSWKGPDLGLVAVGLAVLIGIIAIVLAHSLTQIIKREYEWQKRYVEMVRRTEGNDPLLYQEPGKYKPLPGKDIPTTFSKIKPWIIAAWILFIVLVLPYLEIYTSQPAAEANEGCTECHAPHPLRQIENMKCQHHSLYEVICIEDYGGQYFLDIHYCVALGAHP